MLHFILHPSVSMYGQWTVRRFVWDLKHLHSSPSMSNWTWITFSCWVTIVYVLRTKDLHTVTWTDNKDLAPTAVVCWTVLTLYLAEMCCKDAFKLKQNMCSNMHSIMSRHEKKRYGCFQKFRRKRHWCVHTYKHTQQYTCTWYLFLSKFSHHWMGVRRLWVSDYGDDSSCLVFITGCNGWSRPRLIATFIQFTFLWKTSTSYWIIFPSFPGIFPADNTCI